MKISKALRDFLGESKKSDSYWVEHAKLEFSNSLEKQRLFSKVTYAEIAKKLGTSAAYISKVFRGDTNMTIETMVKLSRATGGQLDIQVANVAVETPRWDTTFMAQKPKHTPQSTATSETVVSFANYAANKDKFVWAKAA